METLAVTTERVAAVSPWDSTRAETVTMSTAVTPADSLCHGLHTAPSHSLVLPAASAAVLEGWCLYGLLDGRVIVGAVTLHDSCLPCVDRMPFSVGSTRAVLGLDKCVPS